MSAPRAVSPPSWGRVALARAYQRLGTTGLAGLMLGALALAVFLNAWPLRPWRSFQGAQALAPTPAVGTAAADAAPATAPAERANTLKAPALPSRREIPLLMTQVEVAVTSQGLSWPAAEYRLTEATAQRPASLEIHTTLKGGYPPLRAVLAQWLTTIPGLTLRALSLTRPTSGAPDVEAKVALTIYLADDATPGDLSMAAKP